MDDDQINALWAELDDFDAPRLPLLSVGEARACVVLLRHYGERDDSEEAALARQVAATIGLRLPSP